ncbi:MAG: tetratricopeptide repeat protein [Helicobacteraceae bacterium]|nr:tetratricopeptide repeat protein [Helicobacteraceae bacterium]
MKVVLLLLFYINFLYSSDSIKELYVKSYNYERVGNYNEAIKVLVPLYKKYPKGYTLNLRFGWLFYLNKNYNNATTYYKNASLVAPYALNPRVGLAQVYLAKGDYNKSEIICNEIIKIDYYNHYANLCTISSLIRQHKYEIAAQMAQKMLTLYPTNIEFLQQLYVIYKATSSKYIKDLENQILTLDPNNVLINTKGK